MAKLSVPFSPINLLRRGVRFPPALSLLPLLLLPALFAGCGGGKEQTAASPAPSVIVVKAEDKPVQEQSQFVGRVVAENKVELRARVEGFLKERLFTEGQQVKEGELLFLIEPEQYESVVQQREADLEKARADQENTSAQLKRGLELVKNKNISQAKVDELQASDSMAKASIAQAKAALDAAKLNLSYTRVTSPIAGRIGLAEYTVGNLVGPASGPLATIVSSDPIYVEFPVTQRQLLEAKRSIAKKGGDPSNLVMRARLPDGSPYEDPGKLNFVDVTTDKTTDTVTLRAVFPNPKSILVDGQYVGVLVESGKPESAIVIPQSALQIDQQGTYVLVVGSGDKVAVRRVTTGQNVGADVAVKSGLKAGELVIAEGAQKVRPGQEVKAVPRESPAANGQGGSAP